MRQQRVLAQEPLAGPDVVGVPGPQDVEIVQDEVALLGAERDRPDMSDKDVGGADVPPSAGHGPKAQVAFLAITPVIVLLVEQSDGIEAGPAHEQAESDTHRNIDDPAGLAAAASASIRAVSAGSGIGLTSAMRGKLISSPLLDSGVTVAMLGAW